jgi:hypothetical protein
MISFGVGLTSIIEGEINTHTCDYGERYAMNYLDL